MYSLIRPLLFALDAEKAHHLALTSLSIMPAWCFKKTRNHPVSAMGLTFPHPVGLAAGLDKNAAYLDALAKIGFSFIEVGTVTPRPQSGNPKPRLFRVPEHQAIINRMGFNNHGVAVLVNNIKKSRYQGILGINIGKNKETSLNDAVLDYLFCLRAVYPYASYVTVNISSPNTPELRELQRGDYFSSLIKQLVDEQKQLADRYQRHVPLLVKISPDESPETLKKMMDVLLMHRVAGVIATNTTVSSPLVLDLPESMRQGGLSGRPLREQATACLRLLKEYVGNDLCLIGVGGIDDVRSAQDKLHAGASLIQLYSGLIYQGPNLVAQLTAQLD